MAALLEGIEKLSPAQLVLEVGFGLLARGEILSKQGCAMRRLLMQRPRWAGGRSEVVPATRPMARSALMPKDLTGVCMSLAWKCWWARGKHNLSVRVTPQPAFTPCAIISMAETC
jgi:hypothetical protein